MPRCSNPSLEAQICTHRRTDGQTNKSPLVFYRTLSPSGPLPCFPSPTRFSPTYIAGQRVSLTTYCPWATGSMISSALFSYSANDPLAFSSESSFSFSFSDKPSLNHPPFYSPLPCLPIVLPFPSSLLPFRYHLLSPPTFLLSAHHQLLLYLRIWRWLCRQKRESYAKDKMETNIHFACGLG